MRKLNHSEEATLPEFSRSDRWLITAEDRILVTGAAGFIGSRVVKCLIERGFRNLVCLARPSSNVSALEEIIATQGRGTQIKILKGNLLKRSDCDAACNSVSLILHLASGTGEKSYPDAFMNSVVATRNLMDASLLASTLKRMVLVSSFAVYSNQQGSNQLDESCPVIEKPELRGDAYCYAKVKQELIVRQYGEHFGYPYVIVRPGSVYGEGKSQITGRIGIGTFGLFLHFGGSNRIPFTFVDNCADAVVLAGLVKGVEGEVFNVVDDNVPTSRKFLRDYKRQVRPFKSLYVPHFASYAFCSLWEKYSNWSKGQLPPAFTTSRWFAEWRRTRYSNMKLKQRLGWSPKVSTNEAMQRYFQSLAQGEGNA